MPDPDEGVAPDGTIRTGARRDRVPAAFEPVLRDAAAAVSAAGAALFVYGSVANGTARLGSSDVDLLALGPTDAPALSARLSAAYAHLCRGVEIAGSTAEDYAGPSDEAHGNRVFLRHYCVHLAGPDHAAGLPAFAADARAARGFNGDIGRVADRWRAARATGTSPEALGVRIARKTLLAVAGLVSVHDATWTTSRVEAVRRWSEVAPGLAQDLGLLESWVEGARQPSAAEVDRFLGPTGAVSDVVARFADLIGLWDDGRP